MARILDLVPMPDGRVGIVLEVPPDTGNSITLWTEAERETHLREAAKAADKIERQSTLLEEIDAELDRQIYDDPHVKSCRDNGLNIAPDCQHHVVITEALRQKIGDAVWR